MILKKLTIENFRSYYGKKEFVFGPRLNLILGSNGDGKSTLFEALNWVLTYKETDVDKLPSLKTLVSAKLFKSLPVNYPAPVRVTLMLANSSGNQRKLVREFYVEKKEDGTMMTAKHSHVGYRIVGPKEVAAISITDILEKEGVFPAKVKKFSILQGEERLNIFDDSTVLAELINMYSTVKDLAPYKDLADFILDKGAKAKQNSQDKRASGTTSAKNLLADIERLRKDEKRVSASLTENRDTLREMGQNIQSISGDYDIIKLIREKKDDVLKMESLIKAKSEELNENYSIRLLDELWILAGFEPIAKEYVQKMEGFEGRIQDIRDEHNRKIGEMYAQQKTLQEAKRKLKESIEAMPGFMPELEAMKQMLQEHRCKYCGTEAPEGSAAYEHIKKMLDEYQNKLEESLEEIKIPQVPPLNLGDNVRTLAGESRSLLRSLEAADYQSKIENAKRINEEIHEKIEKAHARIGSLNNDIERELANSSTGKDLMHYVDDWQEVAQWHEDYGRAESAIASLSARLPEIRRELREKQDKYDKMVSNDKNRQYMDIYKLAVLFERSLVSLEDKTYTNFLADISDRANEYMRKITVDDFRGIITMEPVRSGKSKGAVDVLLKDNRQAIITTPNKSLLTTKCISVIFALADFNQERQSGNGYPLILDAPTSSFDAGKDKSFYKSISKLSSQCLIFTKSFLFKKNDEKGEYSIEMASLKDIDCPVYRIKKNQEGFDQQDLSTIETIVEPIKNTSI